MTESGETPDAADRYLAGLSRRLLRTALQSSDADQFVERYSAFADESTLLLPAHPHLPIGEERSFSIVLVDSGAVVLRGRCGAIELVTGPPGAPPVIRVQILDVDTQTQPLHRWLVLESRYHSEPSVTTSTMARERLWRLFENGVHAQGFSRHSNPEEARHGRPPPIQTTTRP